MVKRFLLSLMLLTAILPAFAATDTSQGIFNARFRTLRVEKENEFLSTPVIRLNSRDKIIISFDEIGDDWSQLQYRLVHCNADWQPSRLVESEFVDGFNFADIEDYAFSSNTFTPYVNYRFEIPDGRISILASGNYVVEVYPQDDPDDVLLRARFQVSEETARIDGLVSTHTDFGVNSEWQQLDLYVDAARKDINPYMDILVTVQQNHRPDTQVTLRNPLRIESGRLVYEHNRDLVFPASNEYRRFETVKEDYPGMGVDAVDFRNRTYVAHLKVDESRADKPYYYDQTQKGRFMIDSYNATDPDLGADYVDVVFTLAYPQIMNGDIYVEGDFTSNRHVDRYKMRYDPETRLYTLCLPLKQGSYNYQYVAVKEGESKGSTALIEGNKYETQNEYNVSVFYRTPASRADRLIGTATVYK